jgi:hypothetical protein
MDQRRLYNVHQDAWKVMELTTYGLPTVKDKPNCYLKEH